MNMTLGKRITLGFSIVLIIAAVLGAVGIVNMRKAEINSLDMKEKYMPEVVTSSSLERSFLESRIAIVNYLYTESETFLQSAQTGFEQIFVALDEADILAKEHPELIKLKELVGPLRDYINRYNDGVNQLSKLFC